MTSTFTKSPKPLKLRGWYSTSRQNQMPYLIVRVDVLWQFLDKNVQHFWIGREIAKEICESNPEVGVEEFQGRRNLHNVRDIGGAPWRICG